MSQHSPPESFQAPHPGVASMPRWSVDQLPDPPRFSFKTLPEFIGPSVLLAGAAIGAGEWLVGPKVTASYGAGLLWLSTVSILAQVLYNLEIMRYTLYTGEPIFTGKFRTLPGPAFWVLVYLLLDFGTVFPYVAANAATPLLAMYRGEMPTAADAVLLNRLGVGIFLLAMVPMIFGGKVYNSLRLLMTFKIVVVLGFLLLLAIGFSRWSTWVEIGSGFFKFGMIPVQQAEDLNNNGILDPGEDFDGDGHLDVVEKVEMVPGSKIGPDGKPVLVKKLHDVDGDGYRDGNGLCNVFIALWRGDKIPAFDFKLIAFLSALVAISGQGGLNNTTLSNYTRDQGWGMGAHVGAIPSLVGGHDIQLSHVGSVFEVTKSAVVRWDGWIRHIVRDQVILWMPACFVGIALPSMLSVEFLRRGTEVDDWVAAGMTAGAVRDRVAETLGGYGGQGFWYMTLFCGFLVLMPTMSSTVDGFVRRWVDVFWTAAPQLRNVDPRHIKRIFFSVLFAYAIVGVLLLLFVPKPDTLIKIATNFYNYAFGFSCFHVVYVNAVLLPKELQARRWVAVSLIISGIFFWAVAVVASIQIYRELAGV